MILNKKSVRLFVALILFAACSADLSSTAININGYDYARMKEIELEKPLKEISGVAYDSASFLAVNDEKGIVYVLDAKTYTIINTYDFAEEGDYEEIQIAGNDLYVLRSDGVIYKMKFDGKNVSHIETFEYAGSKAEYESFYIDPIFNSLVLIPKQSKNGTKGKQTITYTINALNGKHVGKNEHTLNWRDLKSSSMLHPSAVAVNPVTKDMYLLASIEKRLLVLNSDWKLLAEYELDRKQFQQPEGITFDNEGNLYISNEAGEKSPTIIQIPILPN